MTAFSVGNPVEPGFDGLPYVLRQPDLHRDRKVQRSGRCAETIHETNNGNQPIPEEGNETGMTYDLTYDLIHLSYDLTYLIYDLTYMA